MPLFTGRFLNALANELILYSRVNVILCCDVSRQLTLR